MKYCKIWCEWDLGLDNFLFKSEEDAYIYFDENSGIDDGWEELEAEGLVGVTWMEVK